MGWDDNGLPTERRVQNYYGVQCDPTLPYDPDFRPPDKPGKQTVHVSRRNFVELCECLTAVDEEAFEDLWRALGLSVDWDMTYTTIEDRSRRVAQRAFLRNLARGEAYQAEAPVLWDVDFRSAVAQAELEDREMPGAYHRIPFHRADGEPIFIETTRPELIPACVALVAHPDDERYQALFGHTVRTPLFGVEVEVRAHELADPEKGSGIAMICTFGDLTDVVWWRELQLPTRVGRHHQRPALGRGPRVDRVGRRARALRRAGRQDGQAGPGPHRRAAAGVGRARRRAPSHHPPGQVLREGRPAARDRHQPPVVHQQRRARRRAARRPAAPGQGAALAPGLHAGPLRELGRRPQRRLADLPPALLRRPDPGLVPARRRRRGRLRPPTAPDRGPASPSTRRSTRPPASTSPSGASRAASSATPTSWTPGRPRR